jgi:hypothetical protein
VDFLHLSNKYAVGMAQMVDCLSSKREALSSNPSTAKKRKETKKWREVGNKRWRKEREERERRNSGRKMKDWRYHS